MKNGPCLCGDPYCPHCGDPYAAEIEAAEEGLMEAFHEARFSPEEYAIVLRVGMEAVEAAREASRQAVDAYKESVEEGM